MRKLIVGQLVVIMVTVAAMSALGLSACNQTGASSSTTQSSSSSSSSASMSTGLATTAKYELVDRPVMRNENTGDICICASIDEFNDLGFTYGDSVDVVFSNGRRLRGIPYYNGHYLADAPYLAAYPKHLFVEVTMNLGYGLWDLAELSDGDTATVKLRKAGEFYKTQLASDVHYTDEPSDYESEAVFANFRAMSGGNLKADVFYRSATPVSNVRNRVECANHMMKDVGINYVLDLSDNDDEIKGYLASDYEDGVDVSYFASLYEGGYVKPIDLSGRYFDDDFKQSLAEGLIDMTEHDGPYLIHCVEGKDRTGFVCMLLEALAGASYQEMISDYMITYTNYFGISAVSDPERYDAIKNLRTDDMLHYISGTGKDVDLSSVDYVAGAREYLRGCGMTNRQIDAVADCLTG